LITQNTIQQILSRIDIVDIVGSFVKLKKRGANYLGNCPFHNERTPSFTVSPAKEIYKCFGCGRSGNSISFLMEHEKYSYVEALRWLAQKYNVEIEETESSPEQKLQQQVADSLYIINGFAQKFYSEVLLNTEEGRDVGLSYLKFRGFREDTIKKFQLGFSVESNSGFAKAALSAQYNIELLQKSGLVVLRDGNPVDNYRGRIIFPIHNQSGKILGFGARVLKTNDRAPKYINTPENEIYVKSKILYGSYFARQAIDKADECLLVEGYTDVISLHQAGIENVVASGGTSLTPDQLRLIKKYTNNLTIIYDGDSAGIKAALRGLDLAVEERLNVQLVLIPDKEDPDSYVNKVGPAEFKKFINSNKKDFIIFQLEVLLNDIGSDSYKKSTVVNQIAETISKIDKTEDFTRQEDYIKQCAQILKIDEKGLHALVNKFIRDKIIKEENSYSNKRKEIEKQEDILPDPDRHDFSNEAYSTLFQDELQERECLRVLLNYGNRKWDSTKTVAEYMFAEIFDEDGDELFNNKRIPEIIQLYKSWSQLGKAPSLNDFTYYTGNDEVVKLVIETTNHPYELSQKWVKEEKKAKATSKIKAISYEDFMKEIMSEDDPDKMVYYHELDENYKNEVDDALIYLKLKKLKRMIKINDADTTQNGDIYHQVHIQLKEMQIALGRKKGIVYYPFD
jgi:DNA primase